MKLAWYNANAHDHYGYGKVGARFREEFRKKGDVTILPNDRFGWDLMVAVSTPRTDLIGPDLKRKDLVFHTMFEAEPMPPSWPAMLNRAGAVWVPSKWVADLFRSSGVSAPIFIAGYGFDPSVFIPIDRVHRTTPLKVLVWGDTLMSRKHVLKAIHTYVRADLKDATLEIKVNDAAVQPSITITEEGLERADVQLFSQPWSVQDLVAWLHSGDVLIYLSGGEGYGLQPFEAMATGLPVIAMRNTGMIDYLFDGCYLDVRSIGRKPSPTYVTNFHIPNATIEYPDIDMAVEKLRWVAANRDAAQQIGQKGYHSIRHRTWAWAAESALVALRAFVPPN